ncbi:S8 family serine peptidase [Promicromonospora vindobonensis]|uniref:S8 family serine peptidase n=1 Tax=Promicromonospora vindobonensis TaxID=195748 RepID=A0ABW5VVD4_9MICO
MRTRAIVAAALAVAVTTGAGALTGTLASPDGQGSTVGRSAPASSTGDPVTVTLLTGDRVTVTPMTDGHRSTTIHPAEGRSGIAFLQQTDEDRLLVIPSDIAPLVGTSLDEALFDVAGLAATGEDRDTVRVIVQQGGGLTALATATEWQAAGLTPDRRLESVGAVADDVDASQGAKLLGTLRAQDGNEGARTADTPVIDRVWLDAPAEALDADSAPQIGAPQAWDSGATGKGVRIAILDTGIDPTHPDLDENVVATKDFSGTGSVVDGTGHGTHVASIAAGSGDASEGENRGMAPDADLMVGKVLDDQSVGTMSAVIEGMEWAAAQGADVVNLSLGFMNASDGTDPASVAVDVLTKQHGTLFVVAAGNSGDHETISSPGTASSALTVGAVDDADQVTGFSSRGPRADGAIKPDIAAPGDDIVAARANGTALGTVVDAHHVADGGTSMAAPHVAGAAAALLQMRPELTATQARSVLMGSSDTTGGTVWEEGAGRVFVPRALDQELLASPASVSFGEFEPPYKGALSKTVTYRNTAARKVVLDLALSATGPDGDPVEAASLSKDRVTVPANGTASVKVSVAKATGALGRYSGAVVATGAGGTSVRTPVGWDKQPETFDLTVKQVGRDGEPFDESAYLGVIDSADHTRFQQSFPVEGTDAAETTFEVPAGTYFVGSVMMGLADDLTVDQVVESYASQVAVADDTTVTLDAREALPVSFDVPRAAERTALVLDGTHTDEEGRAFATGISEVAGADVYVTATDPVTVGTFDHVTRARLAEPVAGAAPPSYTYDLAFRQAPVTTGAFGVEPADLATFTTTFADPARDVTAALSWSGRPGGRDTAAGLSSPVAPGTRTEYVNAADVRWTRSILYSATDGTPVGQFGTDELSLEPGSSTATTVGSAPHSPAGYRGLAGDQLDILTDWSDSAGSLGSDWGLDDVHLVVRQDGQVVADENTGWATVTVPPSGAGYEVTFDGARGSDRWYTGAVVSGGWSFRAEPGPAPYTRHDLLDLRYDVAGIGLQGRAPRTTQVTVHAVGGDGASVTDLSWSADGGATWTKATLTDGVATVDAPEGASTVSLRATASNTAGETATETVKDAYLVRQAP